MCVCWTEEEEAEDALALRKVARKKEYSVLVEELQLDVGWGTRLEESDRFTAQMEYRTYLKFAKCREASLTGHAGKFYRWLDREPLHKTLTYFLGFVAWDRLGCALQIARKVKGCAYGQVIDEEDGFLRPTQVVQALLKINRGSSKGLLLVMAL